MKKIVFLCVFIITGSALADFINLDKLAKGKEPQNFEQIRKSAIALGPCGGTFIGSRGYILTALHCISTPAQDKIVIKDFKTVLVKTDFEKMKSQPASTFHLGNNGQLPDESITSYKLIASGKGYFTNIDLLKSALANEDLYTNLQQEGYGSTQDWAIIKVQQENTPCVHISNAAPERGEHVWSLSYQARETFEQWKQHEAKQYYSEGIITSGISENMAFQAWLRKIPEAKRNVFLEFFKSALERPGSVFTTVDAVPGVSGSGLFNEKGKMVGVLNSVEWFGFDGSLRYQAGSTQGVSTESILKSLKLQLNNEQIAEILYCPDK